MNRFGERRDVRLAVAALLLGLHLLAMRSMGERFAMPFNATPDSPPAFVDPAKDWFPKHWNRLVVARWDSLHYEDLALRGHDYCPPGPLANDERLVDVLRTCHLNFWFGYPFLGRLLSLKGLLPVDVVLFGISLLASLVFLYLWTSPTIVRRLGLAPAYASLLAFNAHTSSFALVTIQTEPLLLVCSLGALIALADRRYLLAGFLAGAATGARVNGVAVGAACALAIAATALVDRPTRPLDWARRALAAALSFWAFAAIIVYFQIRFGDPLAYFHAHMASYGHAASLKTLWSPEVTRYLRESVSDPLHSGLWVAFALFWFATGHREALRRFDAPTQIYAYALFGLSLSLSVVGSLELGLQGNSRYSLGLLPAFFAIGAVLARRRLGLAAWMLFTLFFYRTGEQCYYVGDAGQRTTDVCH